MKYFLPDSQDLVDPSFDFERERRSATRLRQRDDLYAHEVFQERAFEGILVSKGIVDGSDNAGGRYTLAQRHRLLRVGAREFFRIDRAEKERLTTMGDCGAFTYVKEKLPPYSVDDVISFYLDCGFDCGISVDHVILAFSTDWDAPGAAVPADLRERQEITLELAQEFLTRCQRDRLPFAPLGVAQGWSPRSYARATQQLQKMGYRYIAVGGMVPLKTPEILAGLEAIDRVRNAKTRLHLLGITRTEQMNAFTRMGAESFDSTAPLRQAFKDEKDNYYTMDRTYVAVRVPQVEGNPKLQKMISSGKVSQGKAREFERACLDGMRRLDAGDLRVEDVLDSLQRYDDLCGVSSDYREAYREVLTDRPWKQCPCEVCRALGHHVILFRGAERNRRRGFHNTWVFYRRLMRELGQPSPGTDDLTPSRQSRQSATEVFS
jgi:hypothetical protein